MIIVTSADLIHLTLPNFVNVFHLYRDAFYESIPISLLHHTNGNGIYNTSHPLLERLVGQLEVEAPCPYNSIPYDYRMSQMWVEGECIYFLIATS